MAVGASICRGRGWLRPLLTSVGLLGLRLGGEASTEGPDAGGGDVGTGGSVCESDSLFCSGTEVRRCDLQGQSSTLVLNCERNPLFNQCACGGCGTDRTVCALSVAGEWPGEIRHVADRCSGVSRPCALSDPLSGLLVLQLAPDVRLSFFPPRSHAGEEFDDDLVSIFRLEVGDTRCVNRGPGDPGGTVFYSTLEPGADARLEIDIHYTCDGGATWAPLRIEGTIAVAS